MIKSSPNVEPHGRAEDVWIEQIREMADRLRPDLQSSVRLKVGSDRAGEPRRRSKDDPLERARGAQAHLGVKPSKGGLGSRRNATRRRIVPEREILPGPSPAGGAIVVAVAVAAALGPRDGLAEALNSLE